MCVDPNGAVYVADGYAIRRIDPGEGGMVVTVAGSLVTPGKADGVGNQALYSAPMSLHCAASGDVLVGDTSNRNLRRLRCVRGCPTLPPVPPAPTPTPTPEPGPGSRVREWGVAAAGFAGGIAATFAGLLAAGGGRVQRLIQATRERHAAAPGRAARGWLDWARGRAQPAAGEQPGIAALHAPLLLEASGALTASALGSEAGVPSGATSPLIALSDAGDAAGAAGPSGSGTGGQDE